MYWELLKMKSKVNHTKRYWNSDFATLHKTCQRYSITSIMPIHIHMQCNINISCQYLHLCT